MSICDEINYNFHHECSKVQWQLLPKLDIQYGGFTVKLHAHVFCTVLSWAVCVNASFRSMRSSTIKYK